MLPVELWYKISEYLARASDWHAFCLVCKLFAAIGRDREARMRKLLSSFKMVIVNSWTADTFTVLPNGWYEGWYCSHFTRGEELRLVEKTSYVNGKREGQYWRWYGDGALQQYGTYHDNQREGTWSDYETNGLPSWEVTYHKDEGGDYRRWYGSGSLCMENNSDSTEFTTYRENGMIGFMKHRAGPHRSLEYCYDTAGWLAALADIDDASGARYIYCFHANGMIKEVQRYLGEFTQGASLKWRADGTPSDAGNLSDGFLDGECLSYHENGALAVVCHYQDGQLHGIRQCWTSEGLLVVHELYERGELIHCFPL